jgi:mRNA interferase MazF
MERGDVCWFDPDPALGSEQGGRRPAVIVSRDAINRSTPVVVVIPLTTWRGKRLYPSDVLVHAPEAGLQLDSVALGLRVRSVDRQRLGERLGRLSPATMRAVDEAIRIVFGL